MSEITEEQKEVIRELRNSLNGKCGRVCPMKFNKDVCCWHCGDCRTQFGWLADKKLSDLCPCSKIPYETIDPRFSELLEEEI
ncbi:hypothetical protein C4588_06075 [Candidatus Parcubacteria bacterium]|jgi:hypothetical protein|nr:MAG: hypothetical protein C4588_06075 [Candidatus Parcubacteria bacterium]